MPDRGSRRTLLAVIAGVGSVTGCLGSPGTTEPGTTETRPTTDTRATDAPAETDERTPSPVTTPAPCAVSFGTATETPTPRSTEGCDDVRIESVLKTTTAKTATPTDFTDTPGQFADFIRVELRVTGSEPHELRGCVDSLDGPTPVSETVEPAPGTQKLLLGPFPHHGIAGFDLWIAGCSGPEAG